MRLEAIQKPENHEEGCPTCGGAVCRRSYGEMHAGSFVLDGERVEIRRIPIDGFKDPIVLDEITQYFNGGLYRLWPSERYFSKGGSRLHRDVWEHAFGPIPTGRHIHHKDSNPKNNAIWNLECIEPAEHWSKPKVGNKGVSAKARLAAAEWHKSPEGREWHRQHAKKAQSWTKWKREPRSCIMCGATFDALIRKSGASQKYCNELCKTAHYRERQKAK